MSVIVYNVNVFMFGADIG